MPTTAEKNQFRRLIGDYGKNGVSDPEITSYLNDATYELTADFTNESGASAPVTVFDNLSTQYHPEVIYWGAINYLWNKLGKLSDRHSQSVGATSQNASEKWDRTYQLIQWLNSQYDRIQALGADITMGNLSRYSKTALTRFGGMPEESSVEKYSAPEGN